MKILIIEDERGLAQNVGDYLAQENYICEFATTTQEAQSKIADHAYDCILLDLMLSGGDGLTLLEEFNKQERKDGVIIISAKNSFDDKIKGLELGADDYLAKPFHLPELAARIFSVIRRRQFEKLNVIQQRELRINLLAKTVQVGELPVVLTKKEFDLLLYFISNQNKVVSKNALAEHLSGDIADMLDNHDFVYAHVKNLKRKLSEAGCAGYLKTIYGNGYKWEI